MRWMVQGTVFDRWVCPCGDLDCRPPVRPYALARDGRWVKCPVGSREAELHLWRNRISVLRFFEEARGSLKRGDGYLCPFCVCIICGEDEFIGHVEGEDRRLEDELYNLLEARQREDGESFDRGLVVRTDLVCRL